MDTRKQMKVLGWLLAVYALLAASSYLLFYDQITAGVPGALETQLPAALWQVALVALAELLVLNGLVGMVAGQRYIKDGLVAPVGVHFWADIVWHVAWPLFGG